MKSFRGKLGRMASGMAKAGGAAIAGVATAGAAMAVSSARAIDEGNVEIARATGKTGEALAALEEQGRKVFEEVPESYQQVAATLGAADTLFGGTAEAMGKLTERTLDFSRAAGGDSTANMEALGKVTNIFGEDADKAAQNLDVFTKVGQDYAIAGDELLKILQKQGPSLEAFGLNAAQSAVAIGELNAAGINVRKLGSGFETFMQKAVKAGEDPEEALKKLNKQINNASSEQAKLAIATNAMGPAGVQYVNALQQGIDITSGFEEQIAGAEGSLQAITESSATFSEKFAELQNKVGSALADVALKLMDGLMPALEILTDTLLPALQPLLDVLASVLNGIAPIIQTVAAMLADFLQPVMEALSPVIETLSNLLSATLTPIFENLAPILTALLVPAITAVSGVLKLLEPMFPSITRVVETVMGVLTSLAELLSNIMTAAIETLMPILDKLFEQLGPVITEILDILMPMLEELMEAIGPAIMSVVEALLPVIGRLLEQLGPVIVQVLEALMPLLRTLTDVIVAIVTSGLDILLPPVIMLIDLLGKAVNAGLGWIIENVITPALEGLQVAIGWVSEKAEVLIGWLQDAADWFGKLWDKVSDLGFQGIWDSIVDGFKAAINALIGIWNKLDFGIGPWEIPGWIPGIGGKSFGIADIFPDIPLLAEGGIVEDPTLAVVGEAGPEAVIPLSEPHMPEMGGPTLNVTVNVSGADPAATRKAVYQALNDISKGNVQVLSPFLRAVKRAS